MPPVPLDFTVTVGSAITAFVVFGLAALLRKRNALAIMGAAVIICFVRSFINIAVFNFLVPPLVLLALPLLVKEEPCDRARIVSILLPIPFLAWLASLPGYIVAL